MAPALSSPPPTFAVSIPDDHRKEEETKCAYLVNDNDGDRGYDGRGVSGESCADPDGVDRVCKVIHELFALDRNMEAVLDESGVQLSHDLVWRCCKGSRILGSWLFGSFVGPGRGLDLIMIPELMMCILGRTRQFETMVALLEEMGEKGLLTMETFSIAIKAFAEAKQRKKAVGIFDLMKKHEFKVGVDVINFSLDSLGTAKLGKEGQAVFQKLKDRFTPNLRTYTILLSGWCRIRNLLEAGRAWNEMVDRGFKPDIVSHNVMLEGLLKCKKKSDAIKLFEIMKAKGPSPNFWSYTTTIQDFCKQKMMGEAIEYFEEMVDSGSQPDAALYTCLIARFGRQKKMDMVYNLRKEMRKRGCPPDGRTYNALIKLMDRSGEACKYLEEMLEKRMKAPQLDYNKFASDICKTVMLKMARKESLQRLPRRLHDDLIELQVAKDNFGLWFMDVIAAQFIIIVVPSHLENFYDCAFLILMIALKHTYLVILSFGLQKHNNNFGKIIAGVTGDGCTEEFQLECNYPASPEAPFGKWVVLMCPPTCDKTRAIPSSEPGGSKLVNWTKLDQDLFTRCNSEKNVNATMMVLRVDFVKCLCNLHALISALYIAIVVVDFVSYRGDNITIYRITDGLYGAEILHEFEIETYNFGCPHRTLNGNEADFFFVPVLDSCLITRGNDAPYLSMKDYNDVFTTLIQVLHYKFHNVPWRRQQVGISKKFGLPNQCPVSSNEELDYREDYLEEIMARSVEFVMLWRLIRSFLWHTIRWDCLISNVILASQGFSGFDSSEFLQFNMY
ncbi:hypothetical protein VNO78_17144 [Psophocarpus tetragonolobus]|uniref:Pentatricopeptide repeat-containing protein n=1 Tax=Psophocarpus tetragonolobus TaxID=3891 RepID=A0AAN9XL79_PSOTE